MACLLNPNYDYITRAGSKNLLDTPPSQIKSNQTNLFFYMILQILVCTNKNKMAKYLQWKIMWGRRLVRKPCISLVYLVYLVHV